MSRCKACNNIMSDTEMRRRDTLTGDYTELCTECFTESEEVREEMQNDEDFLDIHDLLIDIDKERDIILV